MVLLAVTASQAWAAIVAIWPVILIAVVVMAGVSVPVKWDPKPKPDPPPNPNVVPPSPVVVDPTVTAYLESRAKKVAARDAHLASAAAIDAEIAHDDRVIKGAA